MKFLIVVGTSREGRNSIYPARKARDLLSDLGQDAELFDLKNYDIPFLGVQRHRTEDPHPDVEEFGQKVENSDGIILVTPEYNHSYSGELKNAIDHLYPEYDDLPFSYITVSAGGFGGARALPHLHEVTLELGGHPGPDLPISNVKTIFKDGKLADDEYRDRFKEFTEECIDFCSKFN